MRIPKLYEIESMQAIFRAREKGQTLEEIANWKRCTVKQVESCLQIIYLLRSQPTQRTAEMLCNVAWGGIYSVPFQDPIDQFEALWQAHLYCKSHDFEQPHWLPRQLQALVVYLNTENAPPRMDASRRQIAC